MVSVSPSRGSSEITDTTQRFTENTINLRTSIGFKTENKVIIGNSNKHFI
jgi:hypothetical protein